MRMPNEYYCRSQQLCMRLPYGTTASKGILLAFHLPLNASRKRRHGISPSLESVTPDVDS